LQAVERRDIDVHATTRGDSRGRAQRLFAVGRFADHDQVRLGAQHLAQALAEKGVIVYDENGQNLTGTFACDSAGVWTNQSWVAEIPVGSTAMLLVTTRAMWR
jgi:hypothetical protein